MDFQTFNYQYFMPAAPCFPRWHELVARAIPNLFISYQFLKKVPVRCTFKKWLCSSSSTFLLQE
jgi:hypothetical protein